MKNSTIFSSALAAALLLPTGCVQFSAAPKSTLTVRSPEFNEFGYKKPRGLVSLEIPLEQTRRYEHRRVYLRRAHDGALGNIELELDYFKPMSNKRIAANGKWATVVILPTSAGRYDIYARLARSFITDSAVVVVRRVEVPKLLKDNLDGDTLNTLFCDSIIDARQALDWIETRPELDSKKIGILGISMGAMRGAVLAGIDCRVKASVLVLGGADIPYIISRSKDGALKDRGISRRRGLHQAAHGCTTAEFEEELRQCITGDPEHYAQYADPNRVLLVLGLCDRVVPFESGWRLRKVMHRPDTRVLVASGHYTAALYLPCINGWAKKFFRKRLNGD